MVGVVENAQDLVGIESLGDCLLEAGLAEADTFDFDGDGRGWRCKDCLVSVWVPVAGDGGCQDGVENSWAEHREICFDV